MTNPKPSEKPTQIECPECDGTGADKPDCYCCKGRRTIHWRAAIRHGFKKRDMQNLEDDGIGDCPSCEADQCQACEGSGAVPGNYMQRERERILLTALNDRRIFPRIIVDTFVPYRKRTPVTRVYVDHDAFLSNAAGEVCRRAGEINWFRTIFGDEISLSNRGYLAAMQLYDDGTQRFLGSSEPTHDH